MNIGPTASISLMYVLGGVNKRAAVFFNTIINNYFFMSEAIYFETIAVL
jgi:hypothetical protein